MYINVQMYMNIHCTCTQTQTDKQTDTHLINQILLAFEVESEMTTEKKSHSK